MLDTIMLMIILTGGGAEPVDASFIEVTNVAECEERAARAVAVFPQAGITYVGHYCANSTKEFEFFPHNDKPVGTKYYMELNFSADRKDLISVNSHKSMEACEKAKGGTCVLTCQKVLN